MLKHFYYIGLVLWLFAAPPAHALTMAVFPIEDLTQGYNGVNTEMTDYLAWQMDTRGFDVIANESIISFMGRNRVRWLGYLDTRVILLASEELGVDLILFGTTSVSQKSVTPALGLTLYLVRTSDARTLWTGNGGLSRPDIVTLLDIGAPEDDALPVLLVQQVLEEWPQELNYSARQQHALEIESIDLTPAHLTRGEKVSCKVSLGSSWPEEDTPRIFFKAAGRVHRAEPTKGGVFSAEWEALEKDGRYTVTMVINWPSGHKKVSFLGTYNIDSTAPQVVLDLKGIKLEGTVAFRDQVIIIPRMLRREPVARWRLTVEDENGEEQLSYLGHGQLPRRFVWDGKANNGWPAEEGIYRVTLQVWDLADNMAVAYQPVAVARTPPTMILEAKNRGRDMLVDLSKEGKVPIAFWRMEMRTSGGELIKVAEGEELPVKIDLRLPSRTIKVADGLVPPSDGSRVIKVADGPGNDRNVIKVADGPGNDRNVIKVADGPGSNKNVIKVADGPGSNKNVIKVADGPGSNKNVIKVADGFESGKKVLKVADGFESGKKVLKVADGFESGKKVLKVADAPVYNDGTFMVVEGQPLHLDALEPAEKETRKVECTIVMRDILGNVVRKRIDDLQAFAAEQEAAHLQATQPVEKETLPVWLEDF